MLFFCWIQGLNLVLLLFPGKEPDSLIECIWFRLKTLRSVGQHSKFSMNYLHLVPLENSEQCRATQQVLYELFTFITPYVVHFLPVLDFRAALNPSIVSADVVLVGS